jgi:ABC-type oligopeptide transport system ATPase subunit
MNSVGLSETLLSKYPHELSGGQRQRVGIARALAMKPDVLIADEPVSSLDVSVQAQILSLFTGINKNDGISIVFITHDLRIVRNIADNMIVVYKGKIEEEGKVEDIYSEPKSGYTRLLLSSIPDSPYKWVSSK